MKEENVSRAVELHESMKELRREIEELKYLKRYIKDNGIMASIITIRVNSSLFAFSDKVANGNCKNIVFINKLIDGLLREVSSILEAEELELESF
jgi:hypothetical protein